ncbi:MAG: hypothetical protein WBP93_11215, partial [Pyrinomonadaceae bacterium]
MHATRSTQTVYNGTIAGTDDSNAKLSWLLAVNQHEAYRRWLFRNPFEEEQMLLMRRPIPTARAYAIFGLLLGALPPAAIFYRLFGYGFGHEWLHNDSLLLFILCLAMNILCSLTGAGMGRLLGKQMDHQERLSWNRMFLSSLAMGLGWGCMTGFMGGLPFFVVGAVIGVIFALPVGLAAFTLFTLLHRLLARGGM